MVIDPAQLNRPNAANRLARVPADSERRCLSCNYPLRGVLLNGNCPECGEPLSRTNPAADRPLSEMPLSLIQRFRAATLMITASILTLIIFTVISSASVQSWVVPTMTLAAHALWLGGIWMMTRPVTGDVGRMHQLGPSSRLRKAAFLSQFIWSVMMIDDVIALVAGSRAVPAMFGPDSLMLAPFEFLGLGALGLFLAYACRVADFARDADAQRAFEWALYGVPITSILAFLSSILLPLPITLILALFQIVCILALPWGLYQLSRSMLWSVAHHREYVEREGRRAARAQSVDDDIDRRLQRMD